MTDWRDPRKNKDPQIFVDILIVLVILGASLIGGWALAHLMHLLIRV